MWLLQAFGDVSALESASIEDVAFVVLAQAKQSVRNDSFHAGNLARGATSPNPMLPPQATPQIARYDAERLETIVVEALGWLQSEKLIAPDDRQYGGGYYVITRLGSKIQTRDDMSSYAKRAYLPHDVLREDIAEVALAPFLAGRYDEAVRAAFTRLEVAIRGAAGYGHDQYGVAMVRDAFSPGKKDGSGALGPLSDPELEFTEREAVAHLFAGAIGYIKNPLSHRELNIDDARVAASRILLANDLMHTIASHVQKMERRQS